MRQHCRPSTVNHLYSWNYDNKEDALAIKNSRVHGRFSACASWIFENENSTRYAKRSDRFHIGRLIRYWPKGRQCCWTGSNEFQQNLVLSFWGKTSKTAHCAGVKNIRGSLGANGHRAHRSSCDQLTAIRLAVRGQHSQSRAATKTSATTYDVNVWVL